ncbi:ubiquitin carboxyl-terminal hydrolase 20 [Lactuca sativa]|uniref:ubiquitinyl hydrolase 1 n=1 Tax=Lactuca sativa TaxID=4236 RepID=A0A9R1W490_LACSA|nr:ubiquitin carboxyl-terminal hydrolase 20 [Lactuca sativa]KAJ0218135.1 hypothetical protein LSAT_V11C300108170 [Lactuca sativa]
MADHAETLAPPSESVSIYADAVESSSPKDSRSPTQTLDRYSSSRRTKVDVHASAHMLFDKISQEEEEKLEDSKPPESQINPLMATEALEDSEELALSLSGAEANAPTEPSSPVAVDDNANDPADETDAWISCNRSENDVYKPLPSVASSSSSWYEDVYEKPSMVGAGLANLGNTCFFNAVMQCFTHSVLLVQGLFSSPHPTPCDCNNERFCLICVLREQIELSLTSTGKVVSPWKFVDNLSYFSSSFQRYQQEDAHEFLQCFLDRLESSFSNLKVKDDTLSSESENLVKKVFGGRVISKLRCCNCNHISDTYEPSVDLSLEIEDAKSLSTALESFTKVEHIEDEEMKFTCDQCKEKVSVEKQLMLDQTPPICAFHLKRFKNDGSYVEKIDKHVEFPLELDLQPYTCGNQSNNEELKYELYAVVVHAAYTSSCGHYYCYIRSAPETWCKFDDSKVTSVSEAYVLSEEAYILFYARQGTPWFSNFMETYKPLLDPNLSNTSPKSVLENLDASIIHSHDTNESCSRSIDNNNKVTVPEAKADCSIKSVAVVPNTPIYVKKENLPLTLKEYGSNRRVVTPTSSHNKIHTANPENDPNRRKTTTTFEIEDIFSPSTPPRSPGVDSSDDETSEVVFASRRSEIKLLEKPSYKRPRNKEVENYAKIEALKHCNKTMPASRRDMLMAAIKSESAVNNKRSKKMASHSPPRKNLSRSSERPIPRKLASSSSFR